jgi:hypothetical protein
MNGALLIYGAARSWVIPEILIEALHDSLLFDAIFRDRWCLGQDASLL